MKDFARETLRDMLAAYERLITIDNIKTQPDVPLLGSSPEAVKAVFALYSYAADVVTLGRMVRGRINLPRWEASNVA